MTGTIIWQYRYKIFSVTDVYPPALYMQRCDRQYYYYYNDCALYPISDSKIIMIPKTGQLRIANVDENDLRHSYTCRIVNKLTGFTQESSTFGRIYFGKRIRSLSSFSFYAPCLNKVGFLEHVVLCLKNIYIYIYI